jgi:AraC-like DNA-binding protein
VATARAHERVEAWRPPVAGVREVFHARFVDHAYPPHTHDAWTVLTVHDGAVRYRLDRHDHGSTRSVVTLLPPHVVHDGRAATGHGFRKQVLYLDPAVLGEDRIGPAVDHPTLPDPELAAALADLHRTLRATGGPLEAESLLALVVERLAWHLDGRPRPSPLAADGSGGSGAGRGGAGWLGAAGGRPAGRQGRRLAERLRDLLDAAPAAPVTLADAAGRLDASPTHLVRAFHAAFGVPPHAYLVARRVDVARGRLLDGESPAQAALAAGFHDQAHLTRHFRRHVGTTPGRYAAGARRR